jgi:Ser/Thr protein kinase RdoA (MazF antagonist)
VGRRSFFIKWITNQDAHGQNELRTARVFPQWANVPAPRLLFEKKVKGGVLAGWEWIEGHDLRARDRDRLPEVFARLGEHHLAMRNEGRLASPLNQMRFNRVGELLDSETDRLTAPFDPEIRARCRAVIARLEDGYPTLIHGDMHPGNILLSGEQIYFVDWSYACNSLNLLDLDYIHSLPVQSSDPSWAVINPAEAALALPAYFRAAGLAHLDPFKTHQAVMVWNLLRTYENGVKNGYRAEVITTREQLFDLLGRV